MFNMICKYSRCMDRDDKAPRTISVSELCAAISAVEAPTTTRLVLVDGLGGAGKSVLAAALAGKLGAPVVCGDDFYRPSAQRRREVAEGIGASFDWRRLELQVLAPLSRGEEARYQRYDWESDRLGGWSTVPCRDTVVVEGVYLLRDELRRYASVSIWVETPREVRLTAGLSATAKRHGRGGPKSGCRPRTPTCLPCDRIPRRCSSLTGSGAQASIPDAMSSSWRCALPSTDC